MRRKPDLHAKAFIFLMIGSTVALVIIERHDPPSWWFGPFGAIFGLALWGLCFWLAGLIHRYFGRD